MDHNRAWSGRSLETPAVRPQAALARTQHVEAAPSAGGDELTLIGKRVQRFFPRDKRAAFARRSCANKELKRDGDSSSNRRASVSAMDRVERFFMILTMVSVAGLVLTIIWMMLI